MYIYYIYIYYIYIIYIKRERKDKIPGLPDRKIDIY